MTNQRRELKNFTVLPSNYDTEEEEPKSSLPSARETFIGNVDGRSKESKAYRAILQDIVSDLGGFDHISTMERLLVKRVASLTLKCELYDVKQINGQNTKRDDEEIERTIRTLVSLCNTLGIERKQIDKTTIDINEFFSKD